LFIGTYPDQKIDFHFTYSPFLVFLVLPSVERRQRKDWSLEFLWETIRIALAGRSSDNNVFASFGHLVLFVLLVFA
jgi:hypothetical protein